MTEADQPQVVDMPKPLEKPPLTLDVRIGENMKTIKMVYGLEMDIRRLLGDPLQALQLAMTDTYTQDYVVRRCLSDTRKMVTDRDELIAVEDVDISGEDVEKILMWALDHALYFFASRAESLNSLSERFQIKGTETTDPQPPTEAGSESSALAKQSDGDLASSKAA